MGRGFPDRWRLALPLALPALGGLAYLAAFGAPMRLIGMNAGALVVAAVWVLLGRMPADPARRLAIAGLAALALTLPTLIGPEVGGVSRWLPLGPVQLHSGALLLPLVTVLAAQERRLGPILLVIAGACLVLQPDAGALAGLAGAGAALGLAQRSIPHALVAATALALALATRDAGTLEPQLFTEGVLAHVAAQSWLFAGLLAAVLFVVVPALLLRLAPGENGEGMALAGLLCGFAVAAVLGPFPYPLIGYGAAPILGFGLALGALARRELPPRAPSR